MDLLHALRTMGEQPSLAEGQYRDGNLYEVVQFVWKYG